jgi:hypothetical protein
VLCGASFALFVLLGSLHAQTAGRADQVTTGVATLYSRDPLAQSLCFRDGGYGGVFQQNEVRNRCSDINFNSYNADAFTVGIEGGRIGTIVDLGTPDGLQTKYGYSETVGKGQGFASIRAKGRKLYVAEDRRSGTERELREAENLFAASSSAGASTARVRLGDVYVLRIVDRFDTNFELMVKLVVIAHVPNESVTFRWQVI